jgi:membrane protease YdiL (CAAX protease family)
MSTTTQKVRTSATKVVFDASSPGFLYTVIVSILTIFAASGVTFPADPGSIAGEITTLLSTGGFFAIVGVVVASIGFPIWNAWKKGALTFGGLFSSTLTWVAIGNILFSALALLGLSLPDGTVEQIVYGIAQKDWTALFSLLVTTIVPSIVRFIKERNQKN